VDLEPLRIFDEERARQLDVARRVGDADRLRAHRVLRGAQVVLSHVPILISLPGKPPCSSLIRATAGAGGSRTTSTVCMTDCARAPTFAVLTPCACSEASRACAASSVRYTPSEIAKRCGPLSITATSRTPCALSSSSRRSAAALPAAGAMKTQ